MTEGDILYNKSKKRLTRFVVHKVLKSMDYVHRKKLTNPETCWVHTFEKIRLFGNSYLGKLLFPPEVIVEQTPHMHPPVKEGYKYIETNFKGEWISFYQKM